MRHDARPTRTIKLEVYARRLRLCEHFRGRVPDLTDPDWSSCSAGRTPASPDEFRYCEGDPAGCPDYKAPPLFRDGKPTASVCTGRLFA